jgi:hypothetical protein
MEFRDIIPSIGRVTLYYILKKGCLIVKTLQLYAFFRGLIMEVSMSNRNN